MSRHPEYIQGYRHAWREAIAFLHARAERMNDPHAQQVLNSAAFGLGCRRRIPNETVRKTSKGWCDIEDGVYSATDQRQEPEEAAS